MVTRKKKPSASKAETKRRSVKSTRARALKPRSTKKARVGAQASRKRKPSPKGRRVSSLHSAPKKLSHKPKGTRLTAASRKPRKAKRISVSKIRRSSAPSFAQAFAVASLLRAAQREQTEAAIKRSRCRCNLRSQKPGPLHRLGCPLYRDHAIDPKRSAAAKLGWKRRRKRTRTEIAGELLKPTIKAMRLERLELFYDEFEEEWHELADEWDIEDHDLYSYLMDSPTVEAA